MSESSNAGTAPPAGQASRPYRYGSNERCQVELPSAASIHVMVHGYSAGSGTMTGIRLER